MCCCDVSVFIKRNRRAFDVNVPIWTNKKVDTLLKRSYKPRILNLATMAAQNQLNSLSVVPMVECEGNDHVDSSTF